MQNINKIILNGKRVIKMVRHTIFLASAYNICSRIAMNFVDLEPEEYDSIYKQITDKCGTDINLSVHYIPTDSKDWKSVVKHDPYFKDVKEIKDLDKFIDLIYKDRDLNGLDVAKYIVSKCKCTHLKLEKLTYICYAEYLCLNNKQLFKDKIYAYKLGPVIKSVYKAYKKNKLGKEDNKLVYESFPKKMARQSRIMASRDGLEKLISINKTIEKYQDFTALELVNLTHKDNSPWNNCGKGKELYRIISDDIIKKYHKYEKV